MHMKTAILINISISYVYSYLISTYRSNGCLGMPIFIQIFMSSDYTSISNSLYTPSKIFKVFEV